MLEVNALRCGYRQMNRENRSISGLIIYFLYDELSYKVVRLLNDYDCDPKLI